MKFIPLVIALFLTGCATPRPVVWYKDGGTQEQYGRDMITCRQLGMQSASANGLANNAFVSALINDEVNKCMRTLGYHT